MGFAAALYKGSKSLLSRRVWPYMGGQGVSLWIRMIGLDRYIFLCKNFKIFFDVGYI